MHRHTANSAAFHDVTTGRRFELEPEIVIAGYTGRDQAAVEAHIAELAAHGIPRPDSVPAYYPVDASTLLMDGASIDTGDRSSGEVEPVLIIDGEQWWVGVGSDHTDRELERTDIAASKRACAKIVSSQVVAYVSLQEQWDTVALRSWVDGELYQDGHAGSLRTPEDLVIQTRDALGEIPEQLVLFMGTVPLLSGQFACGAQEFRARLEAPAAGIALEVTYNATRQKVGQ